MYTYNSLQPCRTLYSLSSLLSFIKRNHLSCSFTFSWLEAIDCMRMYGTTRGSIIDRDYDAHRMTLELKGGTFNIHAGT